MKRARLLLVAVVLAVGSTGCVWPQVRFGPDHTGSNPIEAVLGLLGPGNVRRLAPAWSVATGQPTIGDPVVMGDRVVVNAGSRLLAYTTAGVSAWSFDFQDGAVVDPTIAAGSASSGASEGAGFARLDLGTGSLTFFIPASAGFLVGPSAASGSLIYLPVQVPDPPCLVGHRTFVAQDVGSNDLRFTGNCSGEGTPTVGGGHLYTSSVAGIEAFDAAGSTGCGLDPQIHVTSCVPLWTYTSAGTMTTIAYTPTALFVGSHDGHVYAFDPAGCASPPCAPLWTVATGGAIESSVAVANGVVYAGADDGKLYAIDGNGCGAATCAPLWSVTTGGPVKSSPAIANGVVYVGSDDGRLYAVDAKGCGTATSCAPLWTSAAGAAVRSSPAVALGTVYVGRNDATLTAYRVP